MALFVIADLHLPLGVNKPMDIFGGWDNYVERLEYNWQLLVKPQDTVMIPGDLCWAMKLDEALPDLKFLDALNGTKILSKGNHDLWWSTVTKVNNFFSENNIKSIKLLFNNHYAYGEYALCGTRGWINEYSEPADELVIAREAQRLQTSLSGAAAQGLKPIAFLHYPPLYLTGVNQPIIDVLHRYDVKDCFYGHIHGKKGHSCAVKGLVDGINYHLISSDYLQFMPLDISKFVQSDKSC